MATKRGRLLLSSVKGKIIEWVIVVKEIPITRPASNKVRGSEETNQGRALNHWQKQTVRTLFEGGNWSRAETIRGNTVCYVLAREGIAFKQYTRAQLDC